MYKLYKISGPKHIVNLVLAVEDFSNFSNSKRALVRYLLDNGMLGLKDYAELSIHTPNGFKRNHRLIHSFQRTWTLFLDLSISARAAFEFAHFANYNT